MNIEYIIGFFDADGSISISKNNKKDKFKSIKIDFCNNELNILQNIQKFLAKKDIKSYISTKKPRKINHSINYTLSIKGNYSLKLCKILKSKHLKKIHRINCINKYWTNVTIKNGKYNIKQLAKKLAFERLFFYDFS